MVVGYRLAVMFRRERWALVPLSIFFITRAIDALFLLLGAANQTLFWTPAGYVRTRPPSIPETYWNVVSNWDGQWYRTIASSGYPRTLPTIAGHVVQNEWAFYPVYPGLIRLVMSATGCTFPVAASLISITCGAAAVTLMYRMLLEKADAFVATATVVGLCTFAAAPILQVAYTESLALLLVMFALWALASHRYAVVVVVASVLALTRAVVLPLAAVVAVHWLVRWRRAREDPFPLHERLAIAALAVYAAALTGLWPAIAGLVTGVPGAFFETQATWLDHDTRTPWPSWFARAVHATPPSLTLLVAAAIPLIAYVALRRPARSWGHALRAWVLFYPLYLLMVTGVSASVLRFLVLAVAPAWPFPDSGPDRGLPPQPRRRWCAVAVAAGFGLICQYFWIRYVFIVDGPRGAAP